MPNANRHIPTLDTSAGAPNPTPGVPLSAANRILAQFDNALDGPSIPQTPTLDEPTSTFPLEQNPGGRLIVVSNRLPITIKKSDKGWEYHMSSGGLVSALSGLKKEMSFLWIGWPGLELSGEDAETVKRDLAEKFNAVPVFLSDKMADLHYNGFSNRILWPLLHYQTGDMVFDEAAWEGYKLANEEFASVVADIVEEGDMVWVHDYHLMLLPDLLRKRLDTMLVRSTTPPLPNSDPVDAPPSPGSVDMDRPSLLRNFTNASVGPSGTLSFSIGFFLHTPFPSSEVYRILPVRREILLGVLQSDLIGFHTYDYARHFLSSCTRVLGLHSLPNGVVFEGRLVKVGSFPIGIDPERFKEQLAKPETKARIQELTKQFAGQKVMVGVDRLDYIKGVPWKFEAFELFLKRHPEWREKVMLIQVGVPSRQDVEEYQALRSKVNELVGRINGSYGSVTHQPIHFLHRSVDFPELVALYAVSDVCLVTSSRDGMNLVSFEYIASQLDKNGVLILSEFAGAAQSLNGSIVVNPWSASDLADAMLEALEVPEKRRRKRHQQMLSYVEKHTAAFWGLSYVNELKRITEEFDAQMATLHRLNIRDVVNQFSLSMGARVILLEMDLVLGTQSAHTLSAWSDYIRPSTRILRLLAALSASADVYVYVVSGRSRQRLEDWFGSTGVGLIAEHGSFYKHPRKFADALHALTANHKKMLLPLIPPVMSAVHDDSDWVSLAPHVDLSWQDAVRPVFEAYAERTTGAVVEEKEIDLAFVYGRSDPAVGSQVAGELLESLEKLLSSVPVTILSGNQRIEVHPSVVDKSSAARAVIADLYHTLALVGGNYTDSMKAIGPQSPVFEFIFCGGGGGEAVDRTDEPIFALLKDPATSLPTVVQPSSSSSSLNRTPSQRRLDESGSSSSSTKAGPSSPTQPAGRPAWDADVSRCFTVWVGRKRATDAHYYAKSAREIEVLLEGLKRVCDGRARLGPANLQMRRSVA